jgi:hypothetical protein
MKKLSGKPQNIKTEILGKITFKQNRIFSKSDYVLVTFGSYTTLIFQ